MSSVAKRLDVGDVRMRECSDARRHLVSTIGTSSPRDDPNMGVNRFARIGFPHPYITAHFVGTFEVVCGLLLLLGLLTRLAAVPLLVVISTAIATTKIPGLWRPNQGFWFMVSDARTDFAMLCSLLFLFIAGPGGLSFDAKRRPGRTSVKEQ